MDINKLSKFCVIALFLLSSEFLYAKAPPPGTGESDVKANIFIMMDTSGSMNSDVQPAGGTVTLAGPNDVSIDSNGNVHVVNYSGRYVSVFDSSGNPVTSYGTVNSAPAKIAANQNDDSMYTKQGSKINKYTKTSSSTWDHAWTVTMPGECGSSNDPSDLEVDTSTNNLMVSDQNTDKICEFNHADGSLVHAHQSIFYGNSRYKMAIHGSERVLNLLDASSPYIIQAFNLDNLPMGFSNNASNMDSRFDMEVDRDGNIYLTSSNSVIKYKNHGTGNGYTQLGQIICPGQGSVYGLGVDKTVANNGIVYVPNYGGNTVIKIDMKGDDPNAWSCLSGIGTAGQATKTRCEVAKDVIQALMQDSSLTDGANFGLITWDDDAEIRIPIKELGSQEINNMIQTVTCPGPATHPNEAVLLAKSFYEGNTQFASPIDPNASCQNNYTILISDGEFGDDPDASVLSLYNDLGVKSYVVGFTFGGSAAYNSYATAGQTGTPLFANDEDQLVQTLGDAIRQVIQKSLTFSSPKIMPDVNTGDHIFQAVFDYKARKQWQGKLLKYSLNADGSIQEPFLWDAGAQLIMTSPGNRNIWTVGSVSQPGTNNFTVSNVGELKMDLYY